MFSSISSFLRRVVNPAIEAGAASQIRLLAILQSQETPETNDSTPNENTSSGEGSSVQSALRHKTIPELNLAVDLCQNNSIEQAKIILEETISSLSDSIQKERSKLINPAETRMMITMFNTEREKSKEALEEILAIEIELRNISAAIMAANKLLAKHSIEEHVSACLETMIDDEEERFRFSKTALENLDYGSDQIETIYEHQTDCSLFLVSFKNGDIINFSNRNSSQGELRGDKLQILLRKMKFDTFRSLINELYLSPYDGLKTCILSVVQLNIQSLLELPISEALKDYVTEQFNHEKIGDTLFSQLLEKQRQHLKNKECEES